MLAGRLGVLRPGVWLGRKPRVIAGGGGPDTTTFLALSGDSGYAGLPSTMTVNGVSASPTLSYRGSSAQGTSWSGLFGPTLTIAGSGGDPALGAITPFTAAADTAVAMSAGGKVYQPALTTTGDFPDDSDIAIEIVWQRGTTSTCAVASKRAGTGSLAGWMIRETGTTTTGLTIGDGTTSATVSIGTGPLGSWNHALWFLDPDEASTNGFLGYANGITGAGQNPSALGSAVTSTILSIAGGVGTPQGGALALFNLWIFQQTTFPGGSANATAWQAIASERAARLMGVYPQQGLGSLTPVVRARTSSAVLDRIVSGATRYFTVGLGWTRLCERAELSGGETLKGVLIEPSSTSVCLHSADLTNATWVKTAATISASSTTDPEATVTADGIIGDATLAQHSIEQAISHAVQTYYYSAHVKAGARSVVLLENTTVANCSAYFTLSGNGTVGTTGAGASEATIVPLGNGWYRVGIRYTGTAASHTLRLSPAASDGTVAFTGDGATVDLHVWGVQVENSAFPSSYIATTTAGTTRQGDGLTYKADDGNVTPGTGRLSVDVISQNRDLTSVAYAVTLQTSNNSLFPDAIALSLNTGEQAAAHYSAASSTQASLAGAVDIVDGEKHSLAMSYKTDDVRLFVDGASVATDATAVAIVTAPAIIGIGSTSNAVGTGCHLIGAVRWKSTTE